MKLLTPLEYADAYRYWQQQETRHLADEVADLIRPHLVTIEAEKIRHEAMERYGDTFELAVARRRDAVADAYEGGAT